MAPAERSDTSNERNRKRKNKDLQTDYEKQLKALKVENKKLRQAFMFALEHLQTNANTYGVSASPSLSPSPSPSPSPCKKLKKETTNTKNLVKIQADEDEYATAASKKETTNTKNLVKIQADEDEYATAASEPEKFQTGTPDKNDVVGRMASPVAINYKPGREFSVFTTKKY
ncbi:hypothetical protein QYF36_025898 [Acer negundo]|nr:hypothetical protein QYF36_025898 [Acer negundo]